jgi:AcrR family transcriptional regulator
MDLRQYNTINRIIGGLIDCLHTKPFRELTNKEIIMEAEISSRTFYRYYVDKNELLDRLEAKLIKGLKKALERDRKSLMGLHHQLSKKEILELADPAFKSTLEYCEQHREIARVLLSSNGDIKFAREIETVSEQEFKIRAKYLLGKKDVEIDDPLFVKMYVSQIITLIETWLFYSDYASPLSVRKLIGRVQIMSPFEILKLEGSLHEKKNEDK